MMEDRRELLRKIPKIDEVLQDERLFFFTESTPRAVIVDSVREVIDELRKDILEGRRSQVGTKETLMTEIVARITGKKKKSLRRVINATGVVLHTNLGRANLSDKACESIMDVARNYTNLEYDVKRGSRGSRHDHVEKSSPRLRERKPPWWSITTRRPPCSASPPWQRTRKLLSPGGSWWKSEVPSGCRKSWNRAVPG